MIQMIPLCRCTRSARSIANTRSPALGCQVGWPRLACCNPHVHVEVDQDILKKLPFWNSQVRPRLQSHDQLKPFHFYFYLHAIIFHLT